MSRPAFFSHQTPQPSEVRFLTGFTIIELVIILGILTVLAVVVIIVLNPSEFLKIYNRALSAAEIAAIYNTTK